METRDALIGIISTTIGSIVTWIIGKRKENADISTIQLENSQKVIDMVTQMNEKLEAKVDSLSKKVDELTIEIEMLREENHHLKLGKLIKKNLMKINSIGIKGLELIKKYEGFSAKPYKCPAGIITIGIGSTFYEDGSKVKLTDPSITEERAIKLLMSLLVSFEKSVDSYTRDDINQNQFDALVSFAYNVGSNALKNYNITKKSKC